MLTGQSADQAAASAVTAAPSSADEQARSHQQRETPLKKPQKTNTSFERTVISPDTARSPREPKGAPL